MIDHAAALEVALVLVPVPPEQVVEGSPLTGSQVLGTLGDRSYGVWEMSPGTMRDVETDEVFIVLAGEGTVQLVDDGVVIPLSSGSVVALSNGMRTIWTVSQTFRKVWFA